MEEKNKPENSAAQEQDENIVHAFYVVYNRKEDKFGMITAPGFMENRTRVLGCLADITEQVHEFYRQQKRLDKRIITGVKDFAGKMNFRNFIRGRN